MHKIIFKTNFILSIVQTTSHERNFDYGNINKLVPRADEAFSIKR